MRDTARRAPRRHSFYSLIFIGYCARFVALAVPARGPGGFRFPHPHRARSEPRDATPLRSRACRWPLLAEFENPHPAEPFNVHAKVKSGPLHARHSHSHMARQYGVRSVRRPMGNGVMINYDLTPAEWASGSVTMRFLVENYPKKVIPTFLRGRPCLVVTSVTKVADVIQS